MYLYKMMNLNIFGVGFFKRIVADNEEYAKNLFVNDENWENFEKG